MGKFLWYFPGAGSRSAINLDELGLTDVVPSDSAFAQVANGPDKGSGGILCKPEGFSGYREADQTWRECAAGAFCIGYTTANPPGPSDLARDRIVNGHNVELEDGNLWKVPLARSYDGDSRLPKAVCMDAQGSVTSEVMPKYSGVCALAEEIFNSIQENDGNVKMPSNEAWVEASAQILSVNYRIDKWGITVLGLLSTYNLASIVEALVDVPTFLEIFEQENALEKKSPDSESSTTTDGSEEIEESTPPPSDGSEPTVIV